LPHVGQSTVVPRKVSSASRCCWQWGQANFMSFPVGLGWCSQMCKKAKSPSAFLSGGSAPARWGNRGRGAHAAQKKNGVELAGMPGRKLCMTCVLYDFIHMRNATSDKTAPKSFVSCPFCPRRREFGSRCGIVWLGSMALSAPASRLHGNEKARSRIHARFGGPRMTCDDAWENAPRWARSATGHHKAICASLKTTPENFLGFRSGVV
jgi:hypothetical protein